MFIGSVFIKPYPYLFEVNTSIVIKYLQLLIGIIGLIAILIINFRMVEAFGANLAQVKVSNKVF